MFATDLCPTPSTLPTIARKSSPPASSSRAVALLDFLPGPRVRIVVLLADMKLFWLMTLAAPVIILLTPLDGSALEKYGRPLPSMDADDNDREAEETLFGGYFLTAAFVSNPTFAARPDNTGLVGLRHMLHLETDLYKQYLTFYTDQNFFSDRTNGWIELSEWDGTYAFTGVVNHFGWRLQYERDAPMDR